MRTEEDAMKMYVYETESVAFDEGAVEVVVVIAENREAADKAMLEDPDRWVSGIEHLHTAYKVEEKPITSGPLFKAKVLERLDPHTYD